jgi:hypothetical protein
VKFILKAKKIHGKTIYLRDITEDDAKFVFDLRTNPDKNRYLSATSNHLEDQVDWIINYKSKLDQAYFIICDKEDKKLGCIRMYDPVDDSYCWGSWLMVNGLGPLTAIESVLLIYAYGKHLGFSEARFDVLQTNKHTWSFHEKFSSAVLVQQDDVDRSYVVSDETIDKLLTKYRGFVPSPLLVEAF